MSSRSSTLRAARAFISHLSGRESARAQLCRGLATPPPPPFVRCQAGDVPYAIEVLGLMDEAGTSPSEESLEHLLLACAQARRRARGTHPRQEGLC